MTGVYLLGFLNERRELRVVKRVCTLTVLSLQTAMYPVHIHHL